MKVAVCGSGEVLFFIAQTILAKGYQLTIICPEPATCERLAREFKATVICGDPTRLSVLKDALVERQVLVALLADDAANYRVCQMAVHLLRMTRAVSLIKNPVNEAFFTRMGVQMTFSIPSIISQLVEESLSDQIRQLQTLEEGRILSTVIELHERSPWIGKTLRQIGEIPKARVAGVIRNGELLAGEQLIQSGDKVVTLSTPLAQGDLIRKILGEK
jgi:Trk K+ transport system NAD-binding subunit